MYYVHYIRRLKTPTIRYEYSSFVFHNTKKKDFYLSFCNTISLYCIMHAMLMRSTQRKEMSEKNEIS